MRLMQRSTMEKVNHQLFENYYSNAQNQEYKHIEFNNCTFEQCIISQTGDPDTRSVIKNVSLCNCRVVDSSTGNAIHEDMCIENLSTAFLMRTYGGVFHHVTFKGACGSVMLCNFLGQAFSQAQNDRNCQANRAFYQDIDWALDISRAEFTDFYIRGIPCDLVKRDPITQKILLKEDAVFINWDKLPLKSRNFRIASDSMFFYGYDDTLLVAPKRSREFDALMHDLCILSDQGFIN